MVVDSYHKEIGRKIIHIFALGYLVVYFVFAVEFSHRVGLLALAGLLVVQIVLEYVRLQLKLNLPLLKYLNNFHRYSEENSLGGELYFLLGVLVSLSVFETAIAVAAVLMTVFGDMAAALVGRRYGRIRPAVFGGNKSLEGAAAGLLANLVVGFLFLLSIEAAGPWWQALMQDAATGLGGLQLWPVVVAMALAATVVELTISKIDDNLTIPVISGFVGQIVLLLTLL
jgi:phytol kinase